MMTPPQFEHFVLHLWEAVRLLAQQPQTPQQTRDRVFEHLAAALPQNNHGTTK